MACRARIRLDVPGAAEALHGALLPETLDEALSGAASLRLEGAAVVLDLEAQGAAELRAAVNTFLRAARAGLDAALQGAAEDR